QDGLIHISHLSDTFIKDPRDAVKTGDFVTVRVLEVDVARQRISLSMKSTLDPEQANAVKQQATAKPASNKPKQQAPLQNSMANAFAKAKNSSQQQ
ncbi:MAG: S1 RNA-binding domain-containing protein, partial [Methyloglobulus sp.]